MLAQLTRFAGVGGVATLLHVGSALLIQSVLPISHQVANLFGFGLALCASYVGHARFTFSRDALDHRQFARFLVTALASLGASSLIVWFVTERLALSFPVAMLCVGVLVPGVTFITLRFWVFASQAARDLH